MKKKMWLHFLCWVTVACLLCCTACSSDTSGDGANESVADADVSTTTADAQGSVDATEPNSPDGDNGTTADSEEQSTAQTLDQSTTAQANGTTAAGKPTSTKVVSTTTGKVVTTTTTTLGKKPAGTGLKPSITTSKTSVTRPKVTDYPDKQPEGNWKLYWSDEFQGTSLDSSKWNVETGSKGLVYLQKDNVQVKNGNCYLTLNKQSVGGLNYTSASITTANKFSFQYGRLEFRAKLTYGRGLWPALWTLGDSYLTTTDELGWPVCGEIDVMEMIGDGGTTDKYYKSANSKILGTLHWGPNRADHEGDSSNHYITNGFPADEFHLYAVEWDEEKIVWYVDDYAYKTVELNDPDMGNSFHQKHWIIMNVALCDWAEYYPDSSTPAPQSMIVDYVRVYKKK